MSWLLLLPVALGAADGGSITGRVFNRTRGEYVRDAEVRIEGRGIATISENGGTYVLAGVAPGEVEVSVSYTGYQPTSARVSVAAGQTVTQDFELISSLDRRAGGDFVQLAEFVVSTEREGNAKAIMNQRRSMNITNSVASDVFGDIAEGNVGEFLKHIPGVELNLVEGEVRSVRLRGLGAEYTAVTIDGVALASADAQGASGDARAFSFEQVSLSSMESIEVSKTLSADVDANAPAGTINLKAKRAFDRDGRRITWQANVTAFSEQFDFNRTYGPAEAKTRKILPGGIIEYSDLFLNRRLGVVLNLSESRVYSANSKAIHTWNFAPTATDQRPAVLTAINAIHGPRINERFTTTLTSDFKATPELTLSLGFIYNNADLWFTQRGATFNAGARTTISGASPDVAFTTAATGGNVVVASTAVAKLGKTLTYLPRFEYRRGPFTLEGKFAYSESESWYSPLDHRGAVFNAGNNTVSGVQFRAERSSPLAADWSITQTAGSDWANGLNFATPAITADDGRLSQVKVYSGELNATLTTRPIVPVVWKTGVKSKEEIRDFDLRREATLYTYTGPGARTVGNWFGMRSPYDLDFSMTGATTSSLSGGSIFVPDVLAIGTLYREHPEQFTPSLTATNYYNAYIGNKKYYTEQIDAGYLMGTADLGRWRVRAGLRWEGTTTDSLEFDPLTPRELAAAGYAETNGRATTIPGLQSQYFSKARVHRTADYDHLFPSASTKYRLRENLEFHAGYSRSIRRPSFANIAGVWAINDEALTVNAPNPRLSPEVSDNVSARLAYYFEPVGIIGVSVFRNTVRDLHTTIRQTAEEFGYTGSPELATYTFITSGNAASQVEVRGMEYEYSQSLSFLPGALKGLNVRASYTRNYANATLANLVPHSATAGLSYAVAGRSAYANFNWHDNFAVDSAGASYRRHRATVDVGGSYRLSRAVSLFFTARNVFNEPLLQMQRGGASRPVMQRYEISGTPWTFGVKGAF